MNSKRHYKGIDILFFVEDPGAANFLGDLPQYLSEINISSKIIAAGPAVSLLTTRKIDVVVEDNNDNCQQLLDRFHPALIAVGTSQNPDTKGLSFIDTGKINRIPTVGMVDMAVDSELRFSGRSPDPLRHAPDWLIVPDMITKNAFCNLGFSENNIRICGNPNYDRIRRVVDNLMEENEGAIVKRVFPAEISENRPRIVFISEHVDGTSYERMHRNSEYTLRGRGQNDSRTIIVLEEVLDAFHSIGIRPHITVRLHPKNKIEEFNDLQGEVDFFSVGGDPLELVWCADLVIGMTSMLMMEAVVMGKKTLSVLPRSSEAAWAPNTLYNLSPIVTTRLALVETIHDFFHSDKLSRSKDANFLLVHDAEKNAASFFCELLRQGVHGC